MSEGIRTRVSTAGRWLGADWVGRDTEFFGVSSDSRKVPEGCLFIALRGERFDGHDYVLEAARQGAAAALVERRVHVAIPQIIVPDARLALGQLASAWRMVVGTPLLAITGSNGKTTTKEMAAAVLGEAAGLVLATRGNLNNDIGVPLTLLRLTREHRFGVIEMGANHPHEIAYLTSIVRPDVALLNNAAPAHLEGFGSLEGVASAKGEIFAGLREGGMAVVNADLPFADMWRELARPHRVVTFGVESMADVSATWREEGRGTVMDVRHPRGEFDVRLALAGRHNVMNALAVCAATLAFGVEPGAVQRGLESMRPVHGRLEERSGWRGMHVIDDTYNANPASLRAGMEVLAARKGRRILALGDMGELGGDAAALHAEAGRAAKQLGLDGLYATGDLSRHAVEAFGAGGRHFSDQASLVEALRAEAGADLTVLVKGSRSRRMERVVEALINEEQK